MLDAVILRSEDERGPHRVVRTVAGNSGETGVALDTTWCEPGTKVATSSPSVRLPPTTRTPSTV